jgi:exodeoxyribonuclease VII large subunit
MTDVRQRLEMIERHESFRRPTDRINQLRQLLDDRHRALTLAQQQTLRGASDRIADSHHRLQRFLPVALLQFHQRLAERRGRLDQALRAAARASQNRLARLQSSIQAAHPQFKVRLAAQTLESAGNRLNHAIAQNRLTHESRLDALARQLEALSPRAVLERGYTITSRKKDGLPLTSAADLKPGDKIITRFADGQTESVIEDSRQLSLFE